jgi:hypothetical protein
MTDLSTELSESRLFARYKGLVAEIPQQGSTAPAGGVPLSPYKLLDDVVFCTSPFNSLRLDELTE